MRLNVHISRAHLTFICAVMCTVVFLGLAGCDRLDLTDNSAKYKIVCTTFPQYDWTRQIIGDSDEFDVRLLLCDGMDMHSFQPTVEDMYRISAADMFVYVGGESDDWVSDALKNVKNDDLIVIDMMETIGDSAKVEEIVEGMQEEDDRSLIDRLLNRTDADEGLEYDEHMWLSISNAIIITQEIAQGIAKLDSEHADIYLSNAADYILKLNELDARYREVVTESTDGTVLFGDRFPFRYLVDEYSLDYYAAFAGCSAETEASFETVIFLAGKVDELNLSVIYVTENSDERVAEAIRRNTVSKDAQIVMMNSMQSVTDKDIADGASYLGIMEENLEALRLGLQRD